MAPRITPADVEANIVAEYFFTAAHGVAGANVESSPNFKPTHWMPLPA